MIARSFPKGSREAVRVVADNMLVIRGLAFAQGLAAQTPARKSKCDLRAGQIFPGELQQLKTDMPG